VKKLNPDPDPQVTKLGENFTDAVDEKNFKKLDLIITRIVFNLNGLQQAKLLSFLAGYISKFQEDYKLK